MANIEYAHPFKSMIEGQTAALQNIQRAQAARQGNLDYKYNEWYQPLKQAETQSTAGGELLKQAAAIAHYTHDYSNYNAILAHFLGVPLEKLPVGYGASKGGSAQMRGADLSTNLLPTPFAYGNTYQAGGVGAYPHLPGQPVDPELDKEKRDAAIRYWRTVANPDAAGAGGPDVAELNPLNGLPTGPAATPGTEQPAAAQPTQQLPWQTPPIPMPEQTPMAAPRIPGANAAAADATQALGAGDAAATYGVPTPKGGGSIFQGEFKPEDFNFGSS